MRRVWSHQAIRARVVAMVTACAGLPGCLVDAGPATPHADTAPGDAGAQLPDASAAAPGSTSAPPDRDATVDAGVDGSRADAAAAPLSTWCPSASDPDAGAPDIWRDALDGRTLADRGRILGCVHRASVTAAQVAANPLFGGQDTATHGYELFAVQYVSEGIPGVARAVTGLFYLPSDGATNVAIAAVEHPTSGIGPLCGPTHDSIITDSVAVPLVGRGYAVVATDYAGMGVDNGMVSYLNGASEAAATLDGVRALRRFHELRFDASQLSADFFAIGHSQGGHAALFTHQYFDATVGVKLLGSVALAPGFGNAKDWSGSFDNASQTVGVLDALPTMMLYAHMLYFGTPDPSTWLTDSAQRSLPSIFRSECGGVGMSVSKQFPTEGALFTSTFLSAAASCGFSAPCPSFEPWSTELESEQPGGFASPAPVLLLQGASDTIVLPAQTACIADRLTTRGTPVQACEYLGLDHMGIVAGAMPDAIRWMAARRAGNTPSVCSLPLLSACTL
jgi:hypothetical protein